MTFSTTELLTQNCTPQTQALTADIAEQQLSALDHWHISDSKLTKAFTFKNYYETLAFINAIAYVIHMQDHHPELTVTYNCCSIAFNTHSVNQGLGGLSINDFICAARVDAVFQQSFS